MMQPSTVGHLHAAAIAVWTVASMLVALAGGALSGMLLAGKDLGNSLAAAMGAMFGPVAATPGILVGLLVLRFL
jgi:hypothetical protein